MPATHPQILILNLTERSWPARKSFEGFLGNRYSLDISVHPHDSSIQIFDTNVYLGFAGTWHRDAGRRRRDQLAAAFAIPVADLLQTGGPASQRQGSQQLTEPK